MTAWSEVENTRPVNNRRLARTFYIYLFTHGRHLFTDDLCSNGFDRQTPPLPRKGVLAVLVVPGPETSRSSTELASSVGVPW